MANADGNTLTSGIKPARRAERLVENSHQPLSLFCSQDFVTNADGTTSLKRTRFRVRIPVAPTYGAIAQRWSAFNTFHQFCRHSFSRRMPEKLHVIRWSPVRIRPPSPQWPGVAQWVEQRKKFLQTLSSRFLSVAGNRMISVRMPLELHLSRVRVSPAPSDGAVAQLVERLFRQKLVAPLVFFEIDCSWYEFIREMQKYANKASVTHKPGDRTNRA